MKGELLAGGGVVDLEGVQGATTARLMTGVERTEAEGGVAHDFDKVRGVRSGVEFFEMFVG